MNKCKLGDKIKITAIREIEGNYYDFSDSYIIQRFLSNFSYVIGVVGADKNKIRIAFYDSNLISENKDYLFVVNLVDGDFEVVDGSDETKQGAFYYNDGYYGYVDEDMEYVYFVHHRVFEVGKYAMRKIRKEEYYKNVIGVKAFNYGNFYKEEWGLIEEMM